MRTEATHYEVDGRYPVTEVLGWWCQATAAGPAWFPVMGELHHDKETFNIHERHYHVDPRFLDGRFDAEPAATGTPWHRAYHEVMVFFAAAEHPTAYVVVTDGGSALYSRGDHRIGRQMTAAEGRALIQTRTRAMRCRRPLPPAPLRDEPSTGFRELRDAYDDAEGDICPHKGYDLRSVPIDADGYRQCPLHQLRVRAPKPLRKDPGTEGGESCRAADSDKEARNRCPTR